MMPAEVGFIVVKISRMPYKPTGRPAGRPRKYAETETYSVSGPVGLRSRIRKICAELGCTHGELFDMMLRHQEQRIKRERAAQVSPLHRPRAVPAVAGYTE